MELVLSKFSIMIFLIRDLHHEFSVGKNAIINAKEYCAFCFKLLSCLKKSVRSAIVAYYIKYTHIYKPT